MKKDYVNNIGFHIVKAAQARDDRDLQPLRHHEMQAFEMLYSLHCKSEEIDCLEKRMREMGVWRKYRTATGMLRNTVRDIIKNLPDRNVRHIEELRTKYFVHIVPKPIVGDLKAEKVIDVKDLSMLCESALKDHCNLCMKEGSEMKNCRLRNLFLQIAPPPEIKNAGLCEYTQFKVDDDFFDIDDIEESEVIEDHG